MPGHRWNGCIGHFLSMRSSSKYILTSCQTAGRTTKASDVWFSYSRHCTMANGATFLSVCKVWLSSGCSARSFLTQQVRMFVKVVYWNKLSRSWFSNYVKTSVVFNNWNFETTRVKRLYKTKQKTNKKLTWELCVLETVVADLQRPDLDVEYLQNETEMFGQALGINKYTE